MRNSLLTLGLSLLLPAAALAQTTNSGTDKFAQLGTELPTPNEYRTASGAPGPRYWQQRADYNIQVSLDDQQQAITGAETVTYTNLSPDVLTYLWVQLDQNILAKNSMTTATTVSQVAAGRLSFQELDAQFATADFDGGFKIGAVTDAAGKPLRYTINHTMMRIDLPQPLRPQQAISFGVKWQYNVSDQLKINERSGYEYFPDDKNYLYEIAQFYPRMAVYSDNHRLAEQAVSGQRGIYAALWRLPGQHHRAGRPRGGRHRHPAKRRPGAHGRSNQPVGAGAHGQKARVDCDRTTRRYAQ